VSFSLICVWFKTNMFFLCLIGGAGQLKRLPSQNNKKSSSRSWALFAGVGPSMFACVLQHRATLGPDMIINQ
jgi:hypothetical protein